MEPGSRRQRLCFVSCRTRMRSLLLLYFGWGLTQSYNPTGGSAMEKRRALVDAGVMLEVERGRTGM